MMLKPYFSIIIPVYNKAKQLPQTLEAVLAQTFTDFEIILINDGSTDESEAVIVAFTDPRIHYYTQKNQGVSAARNTGIEKANATYLAFLDADDLWYPFYLETQYELIQKYPDQSVFATAQEVAEKNRIFPKTYSILLTSASDFIVNFFEASLDYAILHSSSIVLKKNVFNKVGQYNINIKTGEDTDLYIRIGLVYAVVFSKKICVRYLVLPESLFRSTKILAERADFSAYEHLEKENPLLKKFLDLNRFSLAIFAKLINDQEGFKRNLEKIDLNNLNKKQRLMLKLSPKSTQFLYGLKNIFQRFGVRLSAFK
jgi:glycosyltransferase involved in cell wall biosynthesis